MSDGNASAGARGEECSETTDDGSPCGLPASRADGRCHHHTEIGGRAATDGGAELDDYDGMLATLDVAVEEAREKIESGRIRDEEKEKIRIKWVRALAYTVNVRRQVTQDRDLEELTERLEQLEDRHEEDEF